MIGYPPIEELEKFYTEKKGQIVHKTISNAITKLWHVVHDESIMGIGCAYPFLKDFVGYNNMLISVIPYLGEQSKLPAVNRDGVDIFTVAHEYALPFADNSIDKILMVHSLEYSMNIQQMMREMWRVMKTHGKLIMIVPNKLSIWPYIEKTPFNDCQFFTMNEVLNLLHDSMFEPINSGTALFGLSDFCSSIPHLSSLVENFGNKLLSPFGGVIIVETEKMICVTNSRTRKNKTKKLVLNIGH